MNVIWQEWKPTPWSSSWDAPYCSWMACWNSGSVQWKRTSALSLAISKHFIWARHALTLTLCLCHVVSLHTHGPGTDRSEAFVQNKQKHIRVGFLSFFLKACWSDRHGWGTTTSHFTLAAVWSSEVWTVWIWFPARRLVLIVCQNNPSCVDIQSSLHCKHRTLSRGVILSGGPRGFVFRAE